MPCAVGCQERRRAFCPFDCCRFFFPPLSQVSYFEVYLDKIKDLLDRMFFRDHATKEKNKTKKGLNENLG